MNHWEKKFENFDGLIRKTNWIFLWKFNFSWFFFSKVWNKWKLSKEKSSSNCPKTFPAHYIITWKRDWKKLRTKNLPTEQKVQTRWYRLLINSIKQKKIPTKIHRNFLAKKVIIKIINKFIFIELRKMLIKSKIAEQVNFSSSIIGIKYEMKSKIKFFFFHKNMIKKLVEKL